MMMAQNSRIDFNRPYKPLAATLARQAFERANVDTDRRREYGEDAMQEAAVALWRNRHRSRQYATVCGRNEVLDWIFRFLRGDKRKRPWDGQGRIEMVGLDSSLAAGQSPEELLIAREETAGRQEALEEAAQIVLGIMLAARKQKRGRAVQAATRDANIILLAMQGHPVASIARELAIPPRNAQIYLRRARRVIACWLESQRVGEE